MRARQPDREGHVESHGTRIFWEEHGEGARAVLFMPPWQIVDRRVWKLQVPYFARYFRTLTFDPPGNGRSDRPSTGYDHDRMAERVVFAAMGGTAVGHHLLRRVVAAYPHMKQRVPELRLIVVTGPRIDPARLPETPGVEFRRFVPDLYAHLAGCDLAIVQGGLSTCMELTATKRPFLYFPLRNHFEQNVHVPHRLARYHAGVRMDYAEADPEVLAHAVAEGLKHPVVYRDVEADGARRAAELIVPLLEGGKR